MTFRQLTIVNKLNAMINTGKHLAQHVNMLTNSQMKILPWRFWNETVDIMAMSYINTMKLLSPDH